MTKTSVTYVMPVLNEESYLRQAVESIFEQSFEGSVDLVLSLGPSNDRTNEIAEGLVAEARKRKRKIQLVSNPVGTTSSGLNAAIAVATGDVVIRVDAHSKLSPGYTALAVEILNQTGAANVGGLMRAVGNTPFQTAVAWAYMSRFGLGGGAYHVGAEAGPADSVYLGVFRREILQNLGGFDESIVRGQDWELNLRLRSAGHVVWFDPRLEVEYHPRSSWRKLAKQFFDTGLWRGLLSRAAPSRVNLRYLAPPALVLFSLIGLVFGIIGETLDSASLLGQLLKLGFAPLSIYLVGVGLVAVLSKTKPPVELNLTSRIALLAVLPTMHIFWGAGFLLSAFKKS
jgi:glycosyltransferase involved in cell wall biosynthesis